MADQLEANWWGRWDPWVFGNAPQEENRDEPLVRRYTQRAPDQLPPEAAAVLGAQCMPNCDHVWRQTGDVPPEAAQLYNGTPEEYSPDALVKLALKGDNLVKKFGVYPTLCSIQENVLRKMDPQLEYAKQQYEVIPDQCPWVGRTLANGVSAEYSGGVPSSPRIRGLSYQSSNAEHCQYMAQKLWKDAHAENLFVCSTGRFTEATPIVAAPTTTVEKNSRQNNKRRQKNHR